MRPDLCLQEWLGCLTREKRGKREEMVFTRLEVRCNVGMLGQQERVHLEWAVCVGYYRSGRKEDGGCGGVCVLI